MYFTLTFPDCEGDLVKTTDFDWIEYFDTYNKKSDNKRSLEGNLDNFISDYPGKKLIWHQLANHDYSCLNRQTVCVDNFCDDKYVSNWAQNLHWLENSSQFTAMKYSAQKSMQKNYVATWRLLGQYCVSQQPKIFSRAACCLF